MLTAYQGGVEGLGVLEVGQLAGDHLPQSCGVSLLYQLQQGVASKLNYTGRDISFIWQLCITNRDNKVIHISCLG